MAAGSILGEAYRIILVLLIISLISSVVCIILGWVWLFPVMNNSEKNERIEKAQSLILYRSDIEYSDKCINNLDLFLKNGTYETFNINMKRIHKYSKGLLFILFIIIGSNVISFIAFINCACCSNSTDFTKFIFCCGCLLYILGTILNLIFFILLSVYYYKGKFKEFEEFSKCGFIDSKKFMETYDFIFIIHKNYQKVFIVDLIFICLNFGLFLLCISLIISMH